MQFCEFLLRKSPAYPDSRTRLSDVLHAKACTFTRRFTHTTEEVMHMPNIRHVISAGSCLVPESGGIRKVRWGRAGSGKSGGVRVIYFTRNVKGR
jgi:AraC-like DNA-binding protein